MVDRPAEAMFAAMSDLTARPPPELEKLLAVFRYKPGWSFSLVSAFPRTPWDPWRLQIEVADVLDAYGSGTRSRFVTHIPVPTVPGDREMWMRFLRDAVTSAEHHERDEWFVVDGQRPFDPHRGP